jgi:hypothetical protein
MHGTASTCLPRHTRATLPPRPYRTSERWDREYLLTNAGHAWKS